MSAWAFSLRRTGTLENGRGDERTVVGVGARERRRLVEELPNKLRDLLGIVGVINVQEEDGVLCLRIIVEPYPVAISSGQRVEHVALQSGTTSTDFGIPAEFGGSVPVRPGPDDY